MSELQAQKIRCPYCDARILIWLDPSVPSAQYIEDCSVCCQPIEMQARWQEQTVELIVRVEDGGDWSD